MILFRAIRFCLVLDVTQLYHAVIVQWRRAVAVSQHALRSSIQIVNIILTKTSINNLLSTFSTVVDNSILCDSTKADFCFVCNFVLLGVVV